MHRKGTNVPSISNVLRKISDDKTFKLLRNITLSEGTKHIPIKEMDLTIKQYYSRISGLMDAGLIKRTQGRYFPTAFGRIVNDTCITIEETLCHYWKLKAIESIHTSDMSEQDFSKLVDTIIDSYQLKEIFKNSPSLLRQGFQMQGNAEKSP